MVKYYEVTPDSLKPKLLSNRQILINLNNQPIGKNYQNRLEETETVKKQFISFGNLIEAYKATVLIAKLNVKLLKYEQAQTVINDGLDFAKRKNYIMLQGYFLLWQAKGLVELSEYPLAEEIFQKTIILGKHLNLKELFVSPSMTLAAMYLKKDDNSQALKISQDVLANSKNCNIEHVISLLHVAGISAFNNKFNELSRVYLDKAVQLSKDYQNTYLLAMSYTFLALTLADSKEFDKAENFYSMAQTLATQIEEKTTRLETKSIILGYQAKAKLMKGDFEQAIILYQETISTINELDLKNNLEMAQLKEGLAISLNKVGKTVEAEKHFALAKNYQILVNESKQTANCLLSFIPNNCNVTQY